MSRKDPVPLVLDARFVAAAASPEQLPPPVGLEIAFAGRSNVGKSSLINSMLDRRNLVRTSSTPGCTRTITFFEADAADGLRFTLVDLPGYGWARRSKQERNEWAHLVETYLLERSTLALVLILVDVRRGVEDDDAGLIEMLEDTSRTNRTPPRVLVVATKIDRVSSAAHQTALDRLRRTSRRPVLAFSTHDRETRSELWREIRRELAVAAHVS